MTRKELLKNAALLGIFGLLPSSSLFGEISPIKKISNQEKGGFQKINFHDIDIYVLSDGFIRETNVEGYSPNADINEVKRLLKKGFRSQSYIDMSLNVPLVRIQDKLILFDTGLGIFSDENNGHLLDSLKMAGFSPEEITDVFISHGHVDHIGGLIDKEEKIVFKNAAFHINRKEFDFWMNADVNSFKKSNLYHHPEKIKYLTESARKVFSRIESKIKYFDFTKDLYNVFSFEEVPGHTPGMTFFRLSSEKTKLVFIADVAHSDLLLFPHPEWGFFADTDMKLAIASRKKMFEKLSSEAYPTLSCHLPWPGLGYVAKDTSAYRWTSVASFTTGEISIS